MPPVLHDAVTLQHFAVADGLAILQDAHGHQPEPRWTDTVHQEVVQGKQRGHAHCASVLSCTWLGEPASPTAKDLKAIARLHTALKLNEGHSTELDHLGEAESIYFAKQHGGTFVTDDAGAYDFARNPTNLGPGRVLDTVAVLRGQVSMGSITSDQAFECADAIITSGRHLRAAHRGKLNAAYFA